MKKYPRVFIVVLNYNGAETIINCLKSVYQQQYSNYELVVVDNNSKDGSFELAKKYFSNAHFIKNEKNIGFAAGNNVGIRFALEKFADYIFLLNNDAIIDEKAILGLINEAEKNTGAGLLSPVIFDKNNHVWFAGGQIKWFSMKTTHLVKISSNKTYSTDYLSGCAMLIKKEVFKTAGLLDEKYFLYYEDADFCLRAKRNNFGCMVVPDTKVQHFEKSEQDQKNKVYWLVLSGLIFFKNNTPLVFSPWIGLYFILRRIKNWIDIKFNKNELAGIVRQAYRDYKNIAK
jgi:GT2 family glycosyltransferase